MIKIAIIDQTGQISAELLERTRKALQTQVSEDYVPYWFDDATVEISKERKTGVWPIYIQNTIDQSGVNGYHWYDTISPYGKVLYNNDWQYTLSHELLEILRNPYANRRKGYDEVYFVEEVADATNGRGYEIYGVKLSNFITPNYWDLTKTAGVKYDFLGLLTEPRQLADNGYMSFADNLGNYYQAFKVKGKVFYKKLTGSVTPTAFLENPVTYITGAAVLYILYKIFKKK